MRLACAALASLLAAPAASRTLLVGAGAPGQGASHPTLAAAVAAAADGDTIRLAPGDYYECAILSRRGLTLEGAGPTTVLRDQTCQGKAVLVVQADSLTVRDLTLARARVPDRNGAGIRLEAQSLTLERVRFDNNEVGLLAAQAGPGVIRLSHCAFDGGGVPGERPTYALTVAGIALLRVEASTFTGVKGGQISSTAARTELAGNHIDTGAEPGAGAAVSAGGGQLVMQDNVLRLGPNPPPHAAAVVATGAGVTLRRNRLESAVGGPRTLLLDWTDADPVLDANTVPPGDTVVSDAGLLRHKAGGLARDAWGTARALAGDAKRTLKGWLGR